MINVLHDKEFKGRFKPLDPSDYTLELIADLGMVSPTPNTLQPKRFGVFICPNCKEEFSSAVSSVKTGNTKGCHPCSKLSSVTHGQSSVNGYRTWEGIMARCYNTTHSAYHRYGGLGITVDDMWKESPKAFIDYISELPDAFTTGYTIDRIDNNKGYLTGNIRWADRTTQANNSTSGINGKSKYKGVTWNKTNNKWMVRLMVAGKRVLVGYYVNEKEAATAYDNYVLTVGVPNKIVNKDIYGNYNEQADH